MDTTQSPTPTHIDILPNGKRRLRIDASFLSTTGCSLAIVRRLIEGYRYSINNNDTQYGSAFHLFASEMYRTGGNFAAATKAACEMNSRPCNIKDTKAYLTNIHLRTTCFNWWDWHTTKDSHEVMLLPDGTPAVEQNFTFVVYEDDELVIEMCGTIDRLGKIKNGCYCIVDYKTTSSFDIAAFFHEYKLSSQMRTYRYAISHFAKHYPDSIYAKMSSSPIGVRIDGIFLRGKNKDAEFLSSEVMILKDEDMVEYEVLLQRKVKEIADIYYQYKEGMLPMREGMMNGACVKKFLLCDYFDSCAACDLETRQHVLKKKFVQKTYDPMLWGK